MNEVQTKMAAYTRLLAERFKHIRSITEVKELDMLIRTEIHKEQSEDPSRGFYTLLDEKVLGPDGEARMSYMMSSILMHTVGGRQRHNAEATGDPPHVPTNTPLTQEEKKLRNQERNEARKLRKAAAKAKADPKKKPAPAADPKASDPKAGQKRKGGGSKQTTYPSAEHAKLVEMSKEPQNNRVCRFWNASTGCTDADCSFINKCMKCGSTAHGLFHCPDR